MMYGGFGRYGACPMWGGFNSFNVWHIILIIGLVLAVLGLIMMFTKKKHGSAGALEILKIEYVKGQISEEEYTNRKNVLERK